MLIFRGEEVETEIQSQSVSIRRSFVPRTTHEPEWKIGSRDTSAVEFSGWGLR